MGVSSPGLVPAEQPAADSLLDAFNTIDASEKHKHQAVLDYWLSIRGSRDLPPLRELDPLQISEAGPSSVLLELIGGGEDAEIRHLGERLKSGGAIERIAEAPRPSILACIAKKLSIVAISRNFLAFEDEFSKAGATTRCWVTLLPLSSAGAWVDYVYAFVTFEAVVGEKPIEVEAAEAAPEEVDETALIPAVDVLELDTPLEQAEEVAEIADPVDEVAVAAPSATEPEADEPPAEEDSGTKKAGFSFDSITAAAGFYGTKPVKVEPTMPVARAAKVPPPANEAADPAPAAIEDEIPEESTLPLTQFEDQPAEDELDPPAAEPSKSAAPEEPQQTTPASEGTLQSKLADVRAKADEARMAKLRSNAALYEGLSAAYDFAIDAEDSPEEYLKLVEEKGLKIKLRSPMTPVVKLAFDGMCDDSTLGQLEAVLAWALKQELPRGTLVKRIEEEGGIGPILNGLAKAA